VKARKVKGVDPAAPLADGAERIVRVRLDELCSFMPRALDDTSALHDMRIAAKRLRYALEATGGCFGPYASTAIKHVKAIQDVLGEIHDADEHLPEVRALRDALLADFGELWQDLERKGFRSRLEYALTERSHDVHEAPPPGDIISSTQ
jgi:CHAD domain-containing protein